MVVLRAWKDMATAFHFQTLKTMSDVCLFVCLFFSYIAYYFMHILHMHLRLLHYGFKWGEKVKVKIKMSFITLN